MDSSCYFIFQFCVISCLWAGTTGTTGTTWRCTGITGTEKLDGSGRLVNECQRLAPIVLPLNFPNSPNLAACEIFIAIFLRVHSRILAQVLFMLRLSVNLQSKVTPLTVWHCFNDNEMRWNEYQTSMPAVANTLDGPFELQVRECPKDRSLAALTFHDSPTWSLGLTSFPYSLTPYDHDQNRPSRTSRMASSLCTSNGRQKGAALPVRTSKSPNAYQHVYENNWKSCFVKGCTCPSTIVAQLLLDSQVPRLVLIL